VLARLLIALVRLYQRTLSPLLGSHCRFLPSCSEYAVMALTEWGALRGSWLALRRLARCHPFTEAGLDLPPTRHAPPVSALADARSAGLIDGP
jgi:hypothetical protein